MTENNEGPVSRRKFLGVSSAALAAASAIGAAPQSVEDAQKAEHDRSGINPLGEDNRPLHEETRETRLKITA